MRVHVPRISGITVTREKRMWCTLRGSGLHDVLHATFVRPVGSSGAGGTQSSGSTPGRGGGSGF
jgi:hypothetical protein